jgi:plasmid stability protein
MHYIAVDDQLYAKLSLRATAAGYASVDDYVCDILREELDDREDLPENFDHLFTPERLAIIDQAVAELDAGKGIPAERVHEHFRRKFQQ